MFATILKSALKALALLAVLLVKGTWGLLKMVMGGREMSDDDITFDWNGETIHFAHWKNQPPGIYEYTARNRRHHFKFDLVKLKNEIRIYIVEQPGYGSRNTDGHPTHRLEDGKGQYVCINEDHTPTNIPDALTWMVDWAEKTSRYIEIGQKMQPDD